MKYPRKNGKTDGKIGTYKQSMRKLWLLMILFSSTTKLDRIKASTIKMVE
jgi:hypothetical protein